MKTYYVAVLAAIARACWADFEHEPDVPAAGLEVQFETLREDPRRTSLSIKGEGADIDEAVRRFRLFLEGQGLIDSTSGLRR